MNNTNWDDIRFVLAVAEYGSLNAAANALDVTHATVMRRVAAFEARYNRPIFQKSSTGYAVFPEALPLLRVMANVKDAVLAMERSIAGADQSPTGSVRIASTDSLSQLLLPRVLDRVSERFPNVELTLLSANVHHDLTRLTADIAVRPTAQLGEGLTGECAGHLVFGAYYDGKNDQNWIKLEGALSHSIPAHWMSKNIPNEQLISGADSFLVLQQMAATGFGITLLPRFVGDTDKRLHPIDVALPEMAVPVWVASLDEFALTPRFARVRQMLVKFLKQTLN